MMLANDLIIIGKDKEVCDAGSNGGQMSFVPLRLASACFKDDLRAI